MRHRVNSRDVAQEEIEGEVIIVHLTSGFYYSLDGSAADIWSGVVEGATDREIADAVATKFEGDPDRIRDRVGAFLDELRSEDLIVRDESGGGTGPADAVVPDPAVRSGGTFEAPVLNRYSDMQELLLVDPVHEVDDAGWPEKRTQPDE